jgi:hypothetical protein
MTDPRYNLVTVFSPDPIMTLPEKFPDATGSEVDVRNAPIRYYADFIEPLTPPYLLKMLSWN